MKEITFEEMMHNKFDALEEYGGFKLPTKHQKAILELMQNVREATIAECMRIYEDDWGKYTGYKLMEALPTERIKTEKSPPKTY